MVIPGNESVEWQVALHVGRTRSALEKIVARSLDYILSG
jgi:hypothetical protein